MRKVLKMSEKEPPFEELIRFADGIIKHWGGMDALIRYKHHSTACGCMGPDKGFTFCHCRLGYFLDKHKVKVLAYYNEAEALKLMRQRLITALGG